MPAIPRQVKPPARTTITSKVLVETADLLKRYAQFLDSTQDYVVNEVLAQTFRRDREFQTWLAKPFPSPTDGSTSAPTPRAATPSAASTKSAGQPEPLS